MEKLGADAVVAEGMEAGGHIGKLTTMALVRQVADAVSIPVIGAGGVADGRGMAAVLMLGAEAVQVGTRFAVAKESNAHQNFKDKILKAKDIDTVISASVVGLSLIHIYWFEPSTGHICGCGGIGRRTRFRIWRLTAWGFKSLHPH